jgi:hypothetical protein
MYVNNFTYIHIKNLKIKHIAIIYTKPEKPEKTRKNLDLKFLKTDKYYINE